jgi:hypothetical protein
MVLKRSLRGDGMKVRIEMKGLSELKTRLLEADMLHTKMILLNELRDTVEKLKGNSEMKFKIVSALSRVIPGGRFTMESFIEGLDAMSKMDVELFDFSLKYEPLLAKKTDMDVVTILNIEVNDIYFDMFKEIPLAGRIISSLGSGRSKFVDSIKKSIEDEYTKDYKIQVVSTDE